MFNLNTSIRPEERPTVFVAFGTLALLMVGHAVMETARDALFLSSIPAANLPWVYLGIAAAAVIVQKLENSVPQERLHGIVAGWLVFSAIVTGAFWLSLGEMGNAGLYALYIWSGMMASIILVHFWSLLSNLVTVSDAKRIFAVIGAGSGLGAIVGSGIAAIASMYVQPRHLLLITVFTLLAATLGPYLLSRNGPEEIEKTEKSDEKIDILESLRLIRENPYVFRIAALVVISTVTVTFVDIVFKAAAAEHFAAENLASFFAWTYLALNGLSLIVQLFVVRPVIRRLSVSGALTILPSVLAVSGALAAFGAGLPSALGMKGGDGALRYSLHRTAIELLYVPMRNKLRLKVKGFIDVVGQRGGQALGSLAILGGLALDLDYVYFVVAIVALSFGWIFVARSIKGPYLDLFRNVLNNRKLELAIEHPDLDVASLEALVGALSSDDDGRVMAALDILAEEGKAGVIPALILYHPSENVVFRVLEIFMEEGRDDYLSVAERVEKSASSEIRAAIIAAVATTQDDPAFLEARKDSEDPVVRTTARFFLSLQGQMKRYEFVHAFNEVLKRTSRKGRMALIRAIGIAQPENCDDELVQLLYSTGEDVRRAALDAMRRIRSHAFIVPIRDLLADRILREEAIDALVEFGETALTELEKSLGDPTLPNTVRWQVPKAIAAFGTEEAAEILVQILPEETDGMLRYRAVRELERLRLKKPRLALNRDVLRRGIEDCIQYAYQLMDWRITMIRENEEHPEYETETAEILKLLLRDKERHVVDILIRQVGLLYPREDFAGIIRGLKSSKPQRRASSRELLEHLLPMPLNGPIMGLVDDAADVQRVQLAGPFHDPVRLSYRDLLHLMIDGDSEMLRLLAVHHVGELGLEEFTTKLKSLEESADRSLRDVLRRVLEKLMEKTGPAALPAGA